MKLGKLGSGDTMKFKLFLASMPSNFQAFKPSSFQAFKPSCFQASGIY
jgi:hypothetical protein